MLKATLLAAAGFLTIPTSATIFNGLGVYYSYSPSGVTLEDCPTGMHIIAAPGRGATNRNGRLQSLIDKLKAQVPSTTVQSMYYNESSVMINTALPMVSGNITAFSKYCPHTPIMLLGYSIGGMAIMNSLCGASSALVQPSEPISASYSPRIFAAVLYGEESFRAGQVYNAGTCENDAPTFARRTPEGCGEFAQSMRDYCDATDGSCCAGGSKEKSAHYVYSAEYDDDAAHFVGLRYNLWRKVQAGLRENSGNSAQDKLWKSFWIKFAHDNNISINADESPMAS